MNTPKWLVIGAFSLAGLSQGMAAGQFAQQATARDGATVEPLVNEPRLPPLSPDELAMSEIAGQPALGGITLPEGFKFVRMTGGICNIFGGIAGPDGVEISYSIWTPAPPPGEPRHSGHYDCKNGAKARHPEQCKVRSINGELVELAILEKQTIVASYPNRGIDLTATMSNEEHFLDVLLIMLSIPNESRQLSWIDAQIILEHGAIESLRQDRALGVRIRMKNGVEYHSEQPKIDAVVAVLKKCGRFGKDAKVGGLIVEGDHMLPGGGE